MKANYHTHNTVSACVRKDREYVEEAIRAGLRPLIRNGFESEI